MKAEKSNLVDKCLIATPAIKDPLFASSLVYICEHSEHGSMGLVINHQTTQTLDDLFSQLDIECGDETIKQKPVFLGGPVQLEQGFVLHTATDKWQKSIEVSAGIHLTSSMDILQAIANNKGPKDYLVILGFSGWASGQLESELHQNSWLTSASNTELIFLKNSDDKWQMAFDTLGFDISKLSPVSGNA
ncbi:MAG: YqgE/AlgH family protein [Gammaproteobacteria bacterium]|jgi:putative transcriptional regulator|nr:YqgE/AlgH family protein [Gammaproteobacteria bacterium]MCZ6668679.1 YqgE/AlgH family protein [Gammaproteobacteria bacterium]MCZ6723327.1 YqgE/AlgH family protein [Gammaproteobacteria bacterium]MCZ6796442.1 YqgE/AlgH family protein [Gammaproteobacteria bacterium]MCZ6882453.1 YqgE/AlgH family protein [Gammaproteobacteria bacterium]